MEPSDTDPLVRGVILTLVGWAELMADAAALDW
jgi:hypothetical protein